MSVAVLAGTTVLRFVETTVLAGTIVLRIVETTVLIIVFVGTIVGTTVFAGIAVGTIIAVAEAFGNGRRVYVRVYDNVTVRDRVTVDVRV